MAKGEKHITDDGLIKACGADPSKPNYRGCPLEKNGGHLPADADAKDIQEFEKKSEEVARKAAQQDSSIGPSTRKTEFREISSETANGPDAEISDISSKANKRIELNKTHPGIKPVRAIRLGEKEKRVLTEQGLSSPTMYEIDPESGEGARVFKQEITNSAKDHKYGASVYVYPEKTEYDENGDVDEVGYEDMRLFVSSDGTTGFAMKSDGDIVSVYSSPDSSHKGSVYSNIMLAVNQGGNKLDCFDTVLPKMYEKCGFEETERMQWDDQYMPEDWDKETFSKYNNGEPDVVMFEFKGVDNSILSR